MTRRPRHPAERATDREVGVVAAVLVAGSEKAAAHRLGLSHSTVKHHLANARSKVGATTTVQLVWILAQRLPEPEGTAQTEEQTSGLRDAASPDRPGRRSAPHELSEPVNELDSRDRASNGLPRVVRP